MSHLFIGIAAAEKRALIFDISIPPLHNLRNSPMPPLIHGPATDSIYLRLRQRNLCNHRDYQNLARNGAQSNATDDYMLSMARRKFDDAPALVFFALVGNDVCNEKADTVAHMTPPEVFYNNTLRTLRFLEERLPPGSHVVLMGLIDGSVLYGEQLSIFNQP